MEELKQDIFELQRLADSAGRDSVKKILIEQVKKLETELKALELKHSEQKPVIQTSGPKKEADNSIFKTEPITNYSWAQEGDIVRCAK